MCNSSVRDRDCDGSPFTLTFSPSTATERWCFSRITASVCKGRAAHRSLRRLDVRIVAPRAGAAVSADAAAVVGPRDRRHGLEAVEEGVVVQAVHLLVEGVLRQRDE